MTNSDEANEVQENAVTAKKGKKLNGIQCSRRRGKCLGGLRKAFSVTTTDRLLI